MTGDVHLPHRRVAAPALASALAPLCGLSSPDARLRLVTATVAPVAVEIIAVAALVLLHHLPALLVAAGIKEILHD